MSAVVSWTAVADDHGTDSVYLSVDCMKSSAIHYEQLEKDVWKPVHQYLVDNGQRASWALYRVKYGDRSHCDYYTVTTYAGAEQLHGATDVEAAIAAVHPDADAATLMRKTWAARKRASTELWLRIDQTALQPHRYAVINKMYAEDPVAYESMESDVFKAGHQALIDDGHRAGWAVYALISPIGNSIPYNYGTVDFVNDLGPVPMAEAMMRANPNRDLDAMVELLELRGHVLSETWELVTATSIPAAE
ncbi:MAG: hypothetical protein QNJ14_10320 [Woeseiaceae bacterium]|nr:hypothetical protein [Woeseiaceae bacterium]